MRIANHVVGMAGHTDHGKTSLVKLLTGTNTMRLKEEKARGITIDMGFASFKLPDGRRVGVIDVPGHERYIKNMVAGASGSDVIVLVVAADGGVMPQTREHLEIMDLLGKRCGMVALTRIDLADEEITGLALEEVRDVTRGTFLENAPVVPLSAKTGQGFREFWDALVDVIARAPVRPDGGPFFMSVQRVFSSGAGVVVTGIPASGFVKPGDVLEVLPSGVRCRIRGAQAYHHGIERAAAGHSTALNLAGLKREQVFRGSVAAAPGAFTPSRFLSCRFRAAENAPVLSSGDGIVFHTGTSEIPGRIRFPFPAEGGRGGFAQVALDRQAVTMPGEAFIVRYPGLRILAGGGAVLSIDAGKAPRSPRLLADLLGREASLGNAAGIVKHILRSSPKPVATGSLAINTGVTKSEADSAVRELSRKGEVIPDRSGKHAVSRSAFSATRARVLDEARRFHETHPHRLGMNMSEIPARAGTDKWVLDLAVSQLEEDGAIVVKNGTVFVQNRDDMLPNGFRGVIEKIEEHVRGRTFRGTAEKGMLNGYEDRVQKAREAVSFLVEAGRMIRSTGPAGPMLFSATAVDRAGSVIIDTCKKKGHVRFIDLKEALGTSFANAVAFIEHFRSIRLIERRGEKDVLVRREGNR